MWLSLKFTSSDDKKYFPWWFCLKRPLSYSLSWRNKATHRITQLLEQRLHHVSQLKQRPPRRLLTSPFRTAGQRTHGQECTARHGLFFTERQKNHSQCFCDTTMPILPLCLNMLKLWQVSTGSLFIIITPKKKTIILTTESSVCLVLWFMQIELICLIICLCILNYVWGHS